MRRVLYIINSPPCKGGVPQGRGISLLFSNPSFRRREANSLTVNRKTKTIISILSIIILFLFPSFGNKSGFAFSQNFTITTTVKNATCPDVSDGTISVSVTGGALPYTYQWLSSGQNTPLITGLAPGTYSLTITDNSGADSTVSYFVGPIPISIDVADIQNPSCTNNGHVVLTTISGGSGALSYYWNTGETVAGITNVGAGNYAVTVTDANNCTKIFNYPLTETECFVTPEHFFTPNDDGINDTWSIDNSQYFENAHVIVFDRWGTRVYEHKGLYEPWNGKNYLGIPVPVSVYYYFFYQDKDDKQKNAKKGSVTIMR